MTRDQALADATRALGVAFPDRADEILAVLLERPHLERYLAVLDRELSYPHWRGDARDALEKARKWFLEVWL